MPFYDLNRASTTNATPGNETTFLRVATVTTNQETVSITGIYNAGRFSTAGGAQINVKDNTGTAASGGTAQTPRARNVRAAVAAVSTWFNDATAITAGGTLIQRLSIGWAQTGGMGGWTALVPSCAFQMMAAATNPVDMEFTTQAIGASVNFAATLEFSEGQPT